MGFTLYEIDERIRALVDTDTGEISEEALEALEALEIDREAKLLGYGCVIKELALEAKAIEEEAKRMRERAGSVKSRADQLRERVAEAIGVGSKLKDHRVSFYWSGARSKIEPKPDLVPPELQRVIIEPDRALIAEAFKDEEHPLHEQAKACATEVATKRSLVVR